MNKALVFFLALLAFGDGYAQKFRAGLAAGAASSDLAGINPNGVSFSRGGLLAGVFINSKISDKSSWQFEINYIRKGSFYKYGDSLNPVSTYYRLSLDYVEVPLLFRHNFAFNMGSRSVDRFGWEFGPSVGVLARIKSDGLLFQNGSFISEASSDKGQFKEFDFLLNAGLYYRISDHLTFSMRYSNSVVPVIKRELFNQFFYYNFYKGDNMTFGFALRYLFGTGRPAEAPSESGG